jgi:uncharacterized protein YceH (UPF0502 family)
MDIKLNDDEARILGCLIEKDITTPDYYPLTLNALTNACNQKSNRHPVVAYDETAVVRGLDGLKDKGLATTIHKLDSRVPKYMHIVEEKLKLERREVAVLCELLLRGPQTVGEIRNRAGRMYEFRDLNEAGESLGALISRQPPLVVKLPRQPGRKELRHAHLLSGEPEVKAAAPSVRPEAATLKVRAESERMAALEKELAALRDDFEALKRDLLDLRSQFE